MRILSYTFILSLTILILISCIGNQTVFLSQKNLEIIRDESSQTTRDTEYVVSADINCDSKNDYAMIGIEGEKLELTLILGEIEKIPRTVTMEFGLGNSMSQSAMCGDNPKLKLESQAHDLIDVLAANPDGYKKSDVCKGLNIYDGMCDSFHLFWNHKTNTLNWWRL